MRIGFYTPFKPLNHPNPSGDRTIARGLVEFLKQRGHQLWFPSQLRARWIYWQPHRWPRLRHDIRTARSRVCRTPTDLWLTYHCYYKAPDLVGPAVCRATDLPYVIFQGVYATKYRRRLKTLPGFLLNRRALRCAHHIFTNKTVDRVNLRRIVPGSKVTYLAPGIDPKRFRFDDRAREALRRQWGVGDTPVILSAAMFRSDLKTRGLVWLIQACAELARRGHAFVLVIAGDGPMRGTIERLARRRLKDHCRLVGQTPRERMAAFYSAGDIFAFPGFREPLGMVYLEAQACALPVVAFDNGGIPEVVARGHTGLLTPPGQKGPYVKALEKLIREPELRRKMGVRAVDHIRQHHDLAANYRQLDTILSTIAAAPKKAGRAQ
jgi:glycosyltransferase involved in cell wall biosynthesis